MLLLCEFFDFRAKEVVIHRIFDFVAGVQTVIFEVHFDIYYDRLRFRLFEFVDSDGNRQGEILEEEFFRRHGHGGSAFDI